MKAIILAAGKGTRMGALTATTPKCLLPVNGRPILDYQLSALAAAGIEDILVVSGFCASQVAAYSRGRFQALVNNEYESTNSIYSLWLAKDWLAGSGFVLLNGDVVPDERIVANLVNCHAPCAALVDDSKALVDGEMNVVIRDDRIVRFDKSVKAADADAESVQITRFGERESAVLFARIEALIDAGETNRFPAFAYDAVFQRAQMRPVSVGNYWYYEIDTPEDYARCIQSIAEDSCIERRDHAVRASTE